MYTLTVRFKLDPSTDWRRLRAVIAERAHLYEGVAGLRAKAFVLDEASGEYGANYVWDSREALESFLRSDLFAGAKARFGEPEVRVHEVVAYVERDVTQRTVESGAPAGAGKGGSVSFSVTSPAFTPAGSIPRAHTCEGANSSPPLAWSGIPPGTRSLALVVDDPDAPDPAAPKRTFVHWVLYNLPPSATGLSAAMAVPALPAGTLEGVNDWNRAGYGGPCPPIGRHRYFFKLFALDVLLPDLHGPTKRQLEEAMAGHVLARAELVGTYQKQG